MTRTDPRLLWGLLLIALGLLFLVQTLDLIPADFSLLWVVIFGLGGLAFLYVYANGRENWWALIPGFTLLGLATMILISELVPDSGEWAGAIFLGAIGFSFVVIYFTNRDMWWAIIPAGTLLSVAAIVLLTPLIGGQAGGLLFLGLALTFLLVAIVPTPEGQMRWAWIPAVILFALGLLVLASAAPLIGYVWPLVLIGGGLYLLLRNSRRRPA